MESFEDVCEVIATEVNGADIPDYFHIQYKELTIFDVSWWKILFDWKALLGVESSDCHSATKTLRKVVFLLNFLTFFFFTSYLLFLLYFTLLFTKFFWSFTSEELEDLVSMQVSNRNKIVHREKVRVISSLYKEIIWNMSAGGLLSWSHWKCIIWFHNSSWRLRTPTAKDFVCLSDRNYIGSWFSWHHWSPELLLEYWRLRACFALPLSLPPILSMCRGRLPFPVGWSVMSDLWVGERLRKRVKAGPALEAGSARFVTKYGMCTLILHATCWLMWRQWTWFS